MGIDSKNLRSISGNSITVILPVYKNTALTLQCLESCIQSIITLRARLLIINDASPEPDMASALSRFQAAYSEIVDIITNPLNLGFPASVNAGLLHAGECDVALLNSDVITPSNWLEILAHEAYASESIGTVTPLSNNSTITTIPYSNFQVESLLAYGIEEINNVFRGNLPTVEIPTGVGFCMFVTHRCLRLTGKFDENTFGKGYGEENDFCQRAIKLGFVHVVTPNLYCHHFGSISFGEEVRKERVKSAMRAMDLLHPNYRRDVASWIDRNPLMTAKIIRNIQLQSLVDIPIVLFITHGLSGGVVRHVREVLCATSGQIFPLVLSGVRSNLNEYTLSIGWSSDSMHCMDSLRFKDESSLLYLLHTLPIHFIHIHHLAGISPSIVDWLDSIPREKKCITIHDFFMIAGNPTLCDEDGNYVGLEAKAKWHQISALSILPFSPDEWASRAEFLIRSCCKCIFPSVSSLGIFEEAYGTLHNSMIIPHESIASPAPFNSSKSNQTAPGKPLIIALVGALSKEKGADFLDDLVQTAKHIGGPKVAFELIGYAYKKLGGLKYTGPYDDDSLLYLIRALSPDVILFAARWPETYSYTLSAAMLSGLPIAAPNIGAFPERLQEYSHKLLYEVSISPEALIRKLICFVGLPAGACSQVNPFYSNGYIDIIRAEGMQQDFVADDRCISILSSQIMQSARELSWPKKWLFFHASRLYRVNWINSLALKIFGMANIWKIVEVLSPRPLVNK